MITPPPVPVIAGVPDPRVGDAVDSAREFVAALGGADVLAAGIMACFLTLGVVLGVFLVGGTR